MQSKMDNPEELATLGTQDEETGNIGYTRRRINRTSFLCGNRNRHHNAEPH